MRGIKHWNILNDAECRPAAEIVDGGIDYKNATVRVTAPRGCGIKAYVQFFVDRI